MSVCCFLGETFPPLAALTVKTRTSRSRWECLGSLSRPKCHCTREQELMPGLLKAMALSCVFIDLFSLLMVDDLQEHREEAALQ